MKVIEVLVADLFRMLKDDSGASAAEYAMILAVLGGGVAIAAVALGASISAAAASSSTCISTKGQTC
jgi:pilus assembly protein Flp/PilA